MMNGLLSPRLIGLIPSLTPSLIPRPIFGLMLGVGLVGTLAGPVQAQRVIDVTPGVSSQGVSPDTSIAGVFETEASGAVKADSVRIFLNGQDVTSRSTITRNFFSYRPERALAAGAYTVRLDYESTQGQLRSVSWAFAVRSQPTLAISQVTHNATGSLGPGTTLLVTLNGTRGAQASVLLVEDGRTVRTIQAQESSAGVYVATLPVMGAIREGTIVGRLANQGQVAYGVASVPAVFSDQPTDPTTLAPTITGGTSSTPATPSDGTGTVGTLLPAPQLTSHRDGDRITTQGFTLVGRTVPNATVRVLVTATTPIFGGVLSLGGDRLVATDIQADSQGWFEVQVPSPALVQRGTRYQIELTTKTRDQARELTSKTTTVQLRQR
ncbi:MAG: hypothetical protein HC771_09390 [Synechococcales cyanobacterium CRU_2_2]|nr:hypothetical protein [Synechococcales cyanobacterium CRU_2_2]